MSDETWDRVEVTVRRISNGFLVGEEKTVDYRTARSELSFYPSMIAVETALVGRLQTALQMPVAADAEPDF